MWNSTLDPLVASNTSHYLLLLSGFASVTLFKAATYPHNQDSEEEIGTVRTSDGARLNKFMLPVIALLAGVLGGLFGIGSGMLISPLLLQNGIAPVYLLLGMDHAGTAVIFALVCFVASLVGLMVALAKYGRASIILFAVGIVMALSTVLMSTHGALKVWNDFVSGRYMGFKLPC